MMSEHRLADITLMDLCWRWAQRYDCSFDLVQRVTAREYDCTSLREMTEEQVVAATAKLRNLLAGRAAQDGPAQ